jgi:hypothetical protein
MSEYETSLKKKVSHCHTPGDWPCGDYDLTPAQIEKERKWLKDNFPGAQEIEPPTWTYNCFGYAFAYSHGWFGKASGYAVEPFIEDDFLEIDETEVQLDDVVVYRRKGQPDGEPTHAAIISRVESGAITQTKSKFGRSSLAFYHQLHLPDPAKYGSPVQFLRRLARAEHASGVLDMNQANLSAIETALARLSDPDVNLAVGLASIPSVARDIIQSLPGVKELKEAGPEAARAVLALLRREETLNDRDLSAILLYILESYPSEGVKLALAKEISALRFRVINAQLAAETFLNAAGMEFAREDAIAVAFREARKLYPEGAFPIRADV